MAGLSDDFAEAAQVDEIVAAIRPLLAGRPPEVQGYVCAEITAIFLAGHFVPGDAEATARVRDELITIHVATVRDLVPEAEAEILARARRGK